MERSDAPHTVLELDPMAEEETDSAYGDELSTYTASVTSSIVNYPMEYGRRYHAYREGRYLIPNDEKESSRLDLYHALMGKLLGGNLYLAPIGDSPQRVIDLCTGTGIWAIDFADIFPASEVLANDLSPTQPTMIPPNVKFLVDDVEADWGYETQPFDFIHARYLACGIKDLKRLLQQAFNCCKPGGWVEFQDWDPLAYSTDGSAKGTTLEQFYRVMVDAFDKAGYVSRPGIFLEKYFREIGFVNIGVKRLVIPLGVWPKDKKYKELGTWNSVHIDEGLEGGSMAVLTRFESWKPEEVHVLVSKMRQDMKNPKIHAQFDFFVVYGQRPKG